MRALALGLLLVVASGVRGAGEDVPLDRANTNLSNLASMQRGAQLFVNYCLSCHSAEFMRYSRLEKDLGLTKPQIEEYLILTGSKIGDTMQVAMPAEEAVEWFGAPPPDLSVVSRSRGVDWLYTFLRSYYPDPSRPSGWNNTVFANTSMPNVLWHLQGVRMPKEAEEDHGEAAADEGQHGGGHGAPEESPWVQVSEGSMTEAEYDQAVLDLVTFLEYVGEPSKPQRESLGIWVLLFLSLFALLTYLLKVEYWKDVH